MKWVRYYQALLTEIGPTSGRLDQWEPNRPAAQDDFDRNEGRLDVLGFRYGRLGHGPMH